MRPISCALSGLVVFLGLSQAGFASDLSAMPPAEIDALQHRLTDAGCYAGPIDGKASPATEDAIKACPAQDPLLRIETGMHTAQISRVGADSSCRMMATASDDKTLRLWAMPEGRLIRTVRLPIGDGNTGKVYATAISPDGKTLAAAGDNSEYDKGKQQALYLMDIASGSLRRIGAFGDITNHVAFSPDSSRVAVALYGHEGIHVFDRDTGRDLMTDRNYGDQSLGLAFGPDGALYVASYDGFVRRYGPDLKLRAKVKAPGGKRPYGISVSPDGRRVVVGYDDAPSITIFDGGSLKPIGKGDTADVKDGNLSTVGWMPDGRSFFAGGSDELQLGGRWMRVLRHFDANGRHLGTDQAASANSVMDLQPCASGLAFSALDPRFGAVDPDGTYHDLQSPITADMRGKINKGLTVSSDASTVRFGLGPDDTNAVRFDLAAGVLTDAPQNPIGLHQPTATGLPVTDWQDNENPQLGGKKVELEVYEASRSLAIRPDRTGFALGSDFGLRSFDASGTQRWRKPVPGTAWGVNLSNDGQVIVAAYADGTIRWHRWSDGQELLALFVHVPTKRFVAWTPTGYYMASPGGEDLIGWHLNRGWEQEADFFPASRFRDKFNRPDIVRLILKTLDEGEAVKQANATGQRRDDSKPLIERLPPVITILSPSEGSSVAPGSVEIRYNTRSPSGAKIDRVEAFVDGAKVEARGFARTDAAPATPAAVRDGSGGSITLPMPARDTVVSLVAYADGKASDAARVQLKGAVPAGRALTDADLLKPNLYALLIGVTHYDNKSYDLAYPAQDATAFADALKAQEGKLYRHVEVKVLTDKEATALAVKRGLSWLRKQTTAHDLAVVFAAGHGTTDAKGKFWFLPYDMDPDDVGATAVSRDDISDVLFDLPGKKLLFLDACHSGAALNAGARGGTDVSTAINDFAQTEGGVVAYAASTGREFSFEKPEWGHGAFTKALIEGFSGKADLLHKGNITTATLDLFLTDRVKELTNGAQHPVMTRPKTVPDFPIATD